MHLKDAHSFSRHCSIHPFTAVGSLHRYITRFKSHVSSTFHWYFFPPTCFSFWHLACHLNLALFPNPCMQSQTVSYHQTATICFCLLSLYGTAQPVVSDFQAFWRQSESEWVDGHGWLPRLTKLSVWEEAVLTSSWILIKKYSVALCEFQPGFRKGWDGMGYFHSLEVGMRDKVMYEAWMCSHIPFPYLFKCWAKFD